jgi:hypothetical protein
MSRCFQSLAPGILERFWGPLHKDKYSGTGLNVVAPLLQGLSLSPTARHSGSYWAKQHGSKELEIIHTFNRRLIQASDARIIILCGPMDMKGLATHNKIKLDLRGIKFDAFVEMKDNLINLLL